MFRSVRTAGKKVAPTRSALQEIYKMRIRTISAISLVGLTSITAVVLAGPVGIQRSSNSERQSGSIDYLQAMREDLSRQAALENARGPLLIRYMDKRAELDDLINRLESDQQMASEEIPRSINFEQQSGAVDYLQAIREDFSQQAALENARGPLLIRYMDKRAQLDDLINRLKSGQQMAPEEIDRALEPVSR
jgi:uncharacterized protein YdcH (DUF465 family)